MAKLKDIAEKANVSLATASLALNNSPMIKEDTKKRVKYWANKLNYFPNINAQRLAKGKNYNICLMLNSEYFFKSPNIYYLKVLGGIIKEAEETEYTISFSFYSNDNEVGSFEKNQSLKHIDGIIIFDVIDKLILNNLKKEIKLPIVLADNHKMHNEMYGVDNDDFSGAYKATKYMISQGHKELGYIGLPDTHPLGKECWDGFEKVLKENNLKEKIAYKKCQFGIKSGKEAIKYILSKFKVLPTGFFCINDYIAIGVIEELKRKGYKIPYDISIVGMDDMELSSEIDPPLTTVKIKMEKLGSTSFKKIINLINKNYDGEIKTIIDNELIIRDSCRSLKAQNFI